MDDFYEALAADKPGRAAIDSWYDSLRSLTLTTLAGALNRLKNTLSRRPYNMLFEIKESAAIYLKEHPEARKEGPVKECPDCNGEGFFLATYEDPEKPGVKNRVIILCGACENWRRQFGTTQGKVRLKKFEAEYHGYTIEGG